VAAAAYTFFVTMLGTTLPTPLYGLYRQQLHFSDVVQTAVFATYAVGVIVALVVAGQASDRFGRRPVLGVGIACAVLSALVFLLPPTLVGLYTGRVFSGLSAGLFTGTATTALVELAPRTRARAAGLVATAANILGLGAGPLVAGVLAQYLPAPLRLPYLLHLVLLVPAAVLTWRQSETVTSPPAQRPPWRVLRPAVPSGVGPAFAAAATSSFAGFATFGLFTAVEPLLLREILSIRSLAAAGAVAALIFAASVLAQAATVTAPPRLVLPLGCLVLAVGMGLFALSLSTSSLALFITAAVVLGAGHGACFRSGVAAVAAAAPPARRGEVTSTLFVVLYLGISIPVVGVGALSQGAGLLTAGLVFAAVIAALGLLAAVVALRALRPQETE
jgi:predicted MFS family arabinose efflux permease